MHAGAQPLAIYVIRMFLRTVVDVDAGLSPFGVRKLVA